MYSCFFMATSRLLTDLFSRNISFQKTGLLETEQAVIGTDL